MPPRNGRQDRIRQRPIDAVLNPQLPGLPEIPGTIPTPGPIDEAPVEDEVTTEDPWINPFMEVYETTKVGAMERLEEMQKSMSESFAHRGGYFGGKHAIAQGTMAAKTGSYLDQLLAETKMGATEKSYEAWRESRGEFMNLISLIPTLLGSETFENIVQMTDKGSWVPDVNVGVNP